MLHVYDMFGLSSQAHCHTATPLDVQIASWLCVTFGHVPSGGIVCHEKQLAMISNHKSIALAHIVWSDDLVSVAHPLLLCIKVLRPLVYIIDDG